MQHSYCYRYNSCFFCGWGGGGKSLSSLVALLYQKHTHTSTYLVSCFTALLLVFQFVRQVQ